MSSIRNEVNNYNNALTRAKFWNTCDPQRFINAITTKTKRHSNSTFEALTNGEVIEYHPSFKFAPKLQLFAPELRKRLDKQRKEYKNNKTNESQLVLPIKVIIPNVQSRKSNKRWKIWLNLYL